MPTRVLAFVLLAAVAIAGKPAHATGPYVGVSAGWALPRNSNVDTAFGTEADTFVSDVVYAGQIGWASGSGRIEFEFGYGKFDYDKFVTVSGTRLTANGHTRVLSYLANFYYDFIGETTAWVPYVGIGIGAATIARKDWSAGASTAPDSEATTIAVQVGVGLGYSISESVTIGIGYRYFATGEATFSDRTAQKASRHELNGNLRFSF